MKKVIAVFLALMMSLSLFGCGKKNEAPEPEQPAAAEREESKNTAEGEEQKEPAIVVYPLPDTTMENLTDAILSVSLEEGDAYVDDTGKMQMEVKIFAYDQYDMVDISVLKVGDTIVTHAGEVKVTAMERDAGGTLHINGGLEAGGLDLVTDESGIFFETGFNDVKNWYEVGEAVIRVSVDFEGRDSADPEQGEIVLYPGSFLVGEVTDYNFTPYNTTIRVEGGQIVEMTRRYTP